MAKWLPYPSHVVGHGFAPLPGHNKGYHENGTEAFGWGFGSVA